MVLSQKYSKSFGPSFSSIRQDHKISIVDVCLAGLDLSDVRYLGVFNLCDFDGSVFADIVDVVRVCLDVYQILRVFSE